MKRSPLVGLALAALGSAMSGGASAATQNSYDYGPAAVNCQGALPAFAGTLRARPMAIGNEGAGTAFVTCGADGTDLTYGKTISRFFVKAGNASGSSGSVTITCTFVHGYGGGPAPIYVTRSATIAPGGAAFLTLLPSDLGESVPLYYPQASCTLPSGGLIYYTGALYTYEIGA